MSDIALIPAGSNMPVAGALNKKPLFLVTLTNGKLMQQFISIDRPLTEMNYIQTKGIFVQLPEEEIVSRSAELMNANKDSILEMIFPMHRVYSIRNINYIANKK